MTVMVRGSRSTNDSSLIFRPAAVTAHHDDARHELGDHVDQFGLRRHDVVNILVGPRDFVETACKPAQPEPRQIRRRRSPRKRKGKGKKKAKRSPRKPRRGSRSPPRRRA